MDVRVEMHFCNIGDRMITQKNIVRRAAAFGMVAIALAFAGPVALAQTVSDAATTPAAEAPALSPAALARRTALERRLGRKSTALTSYAERAFQPVWLNADGSANGKARLLVDALSRADMHALPVTRYKAEALRARLGAAGPELEAELSATFLAYASDFKSGLLEPRRIDRELNVFPERPDAGVLISGAAAATNFAAFLEDLAPQTPLYRRLVERYATFRSLAARDIWGPQVRKGRTLRPGDRHSRVAQARARLTAMGDLDPNVYGEPADAASDDGTLIATAEVTTDAPRQAFEPDLFDEPMVEALQRFQARHGLNLDGVIGPATLRQLNVTPRKRAEQIAVNLERLRWQNRDLGERHVIVNLAAFTMSVINNGRQEFTTLAVVGKARRFRTPEFTQTLTHIIVNPSWNVPYSIASKEILPLLQEDPTYLSRKGMRLLGADEETIDWATVTAGSFPGRIVQRPGRGNALGTVKFMFPNRLSIYMHDTPSKRLFGRDVRAYSHGCVRLQKPHEFAAYLLTGQVEDPMDYFQSVLSKRRERRITLDKPMPVHVTYRSAWIDEHGIEQFRGDIYGRDGRVARALVKAGVTILQ